MRDKKINRQVGSILLLAALLGFLIFVSKGTQTEAKLYKKEPDSFYYVTADNALWQWSQGGQTPTLIESGNGGTQDVDYKYNLIQSGNKLFYLAHYSYDGENAGFSLKYREAGAPESVLVDENVSRFNTDDTGCVYYFKTPADGPYDISEASSSDWLFFNGISDLWVFDGKETRLLGTRAAACYPSETGCGVLWLDDERNLHQYDSKTKKTAILGQAPDGLWYHSGDLKTIIYQSGNELLCRQGETEKTLLHLSENSSGHVYDTDGQLSILYDEYTTIPYAELMIDDLPKKTAQEQALWEELSDTIIYYVTFSYWRESTGEKTVIAEGYCDGWSIQSSVPTGYMNLVPASEFQKPVLSQLADAMRLGDVDDWAHQAPYWLEDFFANQADLYVFREDSLKRLEGIIENPYDGFSANYVSEQETWLFNYYRFMEAMNIYAVDASAENLGQTMLLASNDSYTSRTAYSEDGAFFYADSGFSGPGGISLDALMQAGQKQPLDTAEGINVINLIKAVNRRPILYLTGVADRAAKQSGTLRCYNGAEAFPLADDVFDYLFYGSTQVAMLQIMDAPSPNDPTGVLQVYENGAYKTLSDEAREIFILDYEFAPMTEEERNRTVPKPLASLTAPPAEAETPPDGGAAYQEIPEATQDDWIYSGYRMSSFDSILFPVPNGWFVGMNSSTPLAVYRKYNGEEQADVNYDIGSFELIEKDAFLTAEEISETKLFKKEDGFPVWVSREEGEWFETDYYDFIKHTVLSKDGNLRYSFYLPVGANAENADIVMFFNHTDSPFRDTATSLADELMGSFVFLPYDYAVKEGDTLWQIALRLAGDAGMYQEIAAYNSLPNANLIYPGQLLRIKEEWLAGQTGSARR